MSYFDPIPYIAFQFPFFTCLYESVPTYWPVNSYLQATRWPMTFSLFFPAVLSVSMNIYLDGSGFNGKTSGYAVVFEGNVKPPIVVRLTLNKTNNEMEYASLIRALEEAETGDHLFTDSQLLVGQVTAGWKVNFAHLRPLVKDAKRLVAEKKVKLTWVPREKNLAGKVFE